MPVAEGLAFELSGLDDLPADTLSVSVTNTSLTSDVSGGPRALSCDYGCYNDPCCCGYG